MLFCQVCQWATNRLTQQALDAERTHPAKKRCEPQAELGSPRHTRTADICLPRRLPTHKSACWRQFQAPLHGLFKMYGMTRSRSAKRNGPAARTLETRWFDVLSRSMHLASGTGRNSVSGNEYDPSSLPVNAHPCLGQATRRSRTRS